MFRLDQACFEEPFRFTKQAMRRFAEARSAQVLVAVANGAAGEELAGFSIVHAQRRGGATVGYLLTLDVAQAFRRRGLAWQMLERAERDAGSAGCEAMLLHVFPENVGAIALYEKRGYARLGAEEHFYGQGLAARVYRKALR